ncbi:MAG: class I SAM-dependent methyltransferase [Pseudomonadota bacterium]|nr:class I SAM-dependent methyltransferase [Pseudomonadota bacterium]
MEKPFSPSCERNRDPILAVLRRYLGDARHVLEIGSGTGQHAVHFAAAMPWLTWQTSDHAGNLFGISQWLGEAGLANTPGPIVLQAATEPSSHFEPQLPPELGPFDAVFTANTLHIMGWPEVQALFSSLPAILADQASVIVYGPFNEGGCFSSDSNREFDASLKARDPRSGIRDLQAVDALAHHIDLRLIDNVTMPANNRMLVWRRGCSGAIRSEQVGA